MKFLDQVWIKNFLDFYGLCLQFCNTLMVFKTDGFVEHYVMSVVIVSQNQLDAITSKRFVYIPT